MTRLVPPWALLAAVMALGTIIYLWGRDDGAEAVTDDIEEQNDAATEDANAASLGRSECLSRDGVFWDFGAGVCRGGAPGGR